MVQPPGITSPACRAHVYLRADMGTNLKPQQRDGSHRALLTQVSICKDDHRIGGEKSLLKKPLFFHLPRCTYSPRSGFPVKPHALEWLAFGRALVGSATSLSLSPSIARRFASLHCMCLFLVVSMHAFFLLDALYDTTAIISYVHIKTWASGDTPDFPQWLNPTPPAFAGSGWQKPAIGLVHPWIMAATRRTFADGLY
jgi:hypothetical protein